jgi:hypothetical protein
VELSAGADELEAGSAELDGSVELDDGIDELEGASELEAGYSTAGELVSVYVNVYVSVFGRSKPPRSRVIVVVTTVFSVMGNIPSARKLDSISSSEGVVLVCFRVRLVCVEVSSSVTGGVERSVGRF